MFVGKSDLVTKYEKYEREDGSQYYEVVLKSGNQFEVEKELGDYLHKLEQTIKYE